MALNRAGAGFAGTPSRGTTEKSSWPPAPGASSEATPASTASSWPSRPRSSDPQGKLTVSEPANPFSTCGGCSAAATANNAFGSARRRAARREESAIAIAFASTPITSVSGRAAAAASTWRPSPVPTSSAMAA